MFQAIWKCLYKCSSGCDRGTLYQLRNLINRRNVVSKPMNAVDACQEFFLTVVEARILSTAMTLFGMNSVDGEPASTTFQLDHRICLHPRESRFYSWPLALSLTNMSTYHVTPHHCPGSARGWWHSSNGVELLMFMERQAGMCHVTYLWSTYIWSWCKHF